ncbi:ABC transporter permease [Streptomyces sp. SID13031]|uniref:ABC transporter permease n=1 Tax=Streptomyces sp. SID13031 TaxID=2706046 RepID=UPI0013CC8D9E|nr:ABC transporter permease [Streptomyces sp. SID13031]NEA32175.1 ABC transporter permease [Streptomyces sp. SID13031]
MTLGVTEDLSPEGGLPADGLAETAEAKQIEGRSLGQIAWARLKKDKIAVISAVVILLIIAVAIFAPLIVKINGFPPDQFNKLNDDGGPLLNTRDGGIPIGGLWGSGTSAQHWLGVEPQNGRDVFSRLVYGTRVSLLVALGGTIIAIVLGTVIGMVAGYFGGWVDTLLSRLMDIMLSFPSLLFVMALTPVIADRGQALLGIPDDNRLRLGVLMFVLGFFGWAYLARIVRGQTLSLREREFVEAARSLGASPGYVIFKQLLPNLIPTLLVYTTLLIPSNITAEAALSFLGVGIKEPTSSWGRMIADASAWIESNPLYLFFPGIALFITVLAFNLLGDSVRDALDPRAGRS